MKENVLNFFRSILSFLDAGWCFLITLFFILAFFILNLCLTVRKQNYSAKTRRGLNLVSTTLIVFQLFSSVVVGEDLSLTIFNFAVHILTLSVFCFVRKRGKIVITEEQKIAVKKFDLVVKEGELEKMRDDEKEVEEKKSVLFCFDKIINGTDNSPLQEEEELKESKVIKAAKKVEERRQTDFEGVKKAIEKTLQKDLTAEERKRLLYLNLAIIQTEKGEGSLLMKEEINEGLSALLRIMSRYAV